MSVFAANGAIRFTRSSVTGARIPSGPLSTIVSSNDEQIVSILLPSGMHPRPLKISDEVTFPLPGGGDISCIVASMYDHSGHVWTATGYTVHADESLRGTFTLTCGLIDQDPEQVSCIGNIRPRSTQFQLELRRDLVGDHSIAKTSSSTYLRDSDLDISSRSSMFSKQLLDKKEKYQAEHTVAMAEGINSRHLSTFVPDILDIFVVYTPDALKVAGSETAMNMMVHLAIDEANEIFATSQVGLRFRLVKAMRMYDGTYKDSSGSISSILNDATYYSADGYPRFDAEQNDRFTLGADNLVIISSSLDLCGLAWMNGGSTSTTKYQVASVSYTCMAGDYTFLHEIGHNLGCAHDLSQAGSGLYSYSHGWCWDYSNAISCDNTCLRSVMAYSQCVTPLSCNNCFRAAYLSNPAVKNHGSPTGDSTAADNAKTINLSKNYAVNLVPSLISGGIIFYAEPNRIPINIDGLFVNISGWNIGSGTDIINVKLAGVSVQSIEKQDNHFVLVRAAVSSVPTYGNITVIRSNGASTVLQSSFSYYSDSVTQLTITEDFESIPSYGLKYFSQTGDLAWFYFANCSTATGGYCENYGTRYGHPGIFAIVDVDNSNRETSLTSSFSVQSCLDTVSSISVDYFAYSKYPFCYPSNFLTIQVQRTKGGAWEVRKTATSKQASSTSSWTTLTYALSTPAILYGVRINSATYIIATNCAAFNPVAVDNIKVSYTSTCVPASSRPTSRPSSLSPTRIPSSLTPSSRMPTTQSPTDRPTNIGDTVDPTVSPTTAPTDYPSSNPSSHQPTPITNEFSTGVNNTETTCIVPSKIGSFEHGLSCTYSKYLVGAVIVIICIILLLLLKRCCFPAQKSAEDNNLSEEGTTGDGNHDANHFENPPNENKKSNPKARRQLDAESQYAVDRESNIAVDSNGNIHLFDNPMKNKSNPLNSSPRPARAIEIPRDAEWATDL